MRPKRWFGLRNPPGSPYTAGVASRPAVFIDRDGTLTDEVGYVNHPARLRLLPRSAEAVRRLNAAGVAAVVATNQAGLARGYFSKDVLEAEYRREHFSVQPHHVAGDLLDAVEWALAGRAR